MSPTDQPSHHEGGRPISEVPSALDEWDRIAAALRPPVALFLDFDGTLSPLVDDPGAAALLEGVGPLLIRLAEVASLAIVSGRGADDVRTRVDVVEVHVAGSHGFEIVRADGSRHDHPDASAARPVLDAVAAELRAAVGDVPGVVIEPKRFGLTVHDRMVAAADVDRVRAATATAVTGHPELLLTVGKRVSEIRPAIDWHKGRAVRFLLDELAGAGPDAAGRGTVVFIGDDRTDEDAFAALGPDDVTIVVADLADRSRETLARFRVDDPGQVRTVLDGLATLLAPTSED